MWNRIRQWIAPANPPPQYPYVHPSLGSFDFDAELGWKRVCAMDGRDVEVVIGSDGEMPSEEMATAVESWVLNWPKRRQEVHEYIGKELSAWRPEWHPTSADRLALSSINVLWPDSPDTVMLYFIDPEDDIRLWHATYRGREPLGFAFDD